MTGMRTDFAIEGLDVTYESGEFLEKDNKEKSIYIIIGFSGEKYNDSLSEEKGGHIIPAGSAELVELLEHRVGTKMENDENVYSIMFDPFEVDRYDYDENFINLQTHEDLGIVGEFNRREKDILHEKAKYHVVRTRIASTSNLCSTFGIGYNRADHILNCLEDEGVVKRAPNGNRRIVVMTLDEYQAEQNKE